MNSMPGSFRRLIVLKDTLDRRRLRIAFNLLRRAGPRVLLLQLMMHTAYRWRLRQLGVAGIEADLPPPVDEPSGEFEPYREGAWPEEVPLVSVVLPCFNYGAFVTKAVNSVLAQTFQDLEIIVVEGGSTDTTTRKIVAGLRRPKMRVLFRDSPCLVGDNRNFGILHARGKYICCLDADDILEPTYLEKALFLLETGGYDILSTSVKRFGADDGGYGVLANPDLSDMLEGNHVSTCAVFRRAMWQQAGGFKDTGPDMPFVNEDWRFWVRLAALGARICNISGEQLLRYRAHPHGSLSNRPNLLPNQPQAPLVRALNADVITQAALERSRMRAALRLRSLDRLRNLIRSDDGAETRPTILLAVPSCTGWRRTSAQPGHVRAVQIRLSDCYRHDRARLFTAWRHNVLVRPVTREIYHLPRFLSVSRWLEFVEYLICAKQVRAVLLAGSEFLYGAVPGLKIRYPYVRMVDLLFNTVAHTDSNRNIAALLESTLVEGENVRTWLVARGEKPERIYLIPSGIDLQRFRPAQKSASVMQQLGFPSDAFIVGFCGRLAEEKGPLSFVKIAASIPAGSPIRFVMTGAGPLEESVRTALQRSRLGDRFHFAGMVTDARDYLGCCDILVLPSIVDGRPTIVMEALAMGIPVIASKVGSLGDLVIHSQTGFLCKPSDLRAFATHIQWLHGHPVEHERMCRAARHFAERHFCLEPMVSAYVRVFDNLIGNGAEPMLPNMASYPARDAAGISETQIADPLPDSYG